MNILLIGRKLDVIEKIQQQLAVQDARLLGATNLAEVQTAFDETQVDHVIMGAGIDLEVRLAIVREIFMRSDTATVHMKDRATGPQGFLPFVRALLPVLISGFAAE